MKNKALLFFFLIFSASLFGSVDDSNTVSLLHFNSGFSDESGKIWVPYGSASISTATSKFGGACLYLDGVDSYLVSSATGTWYSDFDFGSGSWTIDWWEARLDDRQGVTITRARSSSYPPWFFGYNSYRSCFGVASSSLGPFGIYDGITGYDGRDGSFNHIALVRDCSTNPPTIHYFFNGLEVLSDVDSGDDVYQAFGQVSIGNGNTRNTFDSSYFTDYFFYGYIDEMRFSKGVARWTSSFDPPTAEYQPQPAVADVLRLNAAESGAIHFAPGGEIRLTGN